MLDPKILRAAAGCLFPAFYLPALNDCIYPSTSNMTEDKENLITISRLRVQKNIHDERDIDQVSIEVIKKCIYIGSNYKLHFKDIDDRTFKKQMDRLEKTLEEGHGGYFEFLLKSLDRAKPQFYLGVNGNQALRMLNRFMSHVSNRYYRWFDKDNDADEQILYSTVRPGISKITPPIVSKPPPYKRPRSVYGSKPKSKYEKMRQSILSRSMNYDDSDVDEEVEDPGEEPRMSSVHQHPDSHKEGGNDTSQEFRKESDHEKDVQDSKGKIRLKKLKGIRRSNIKDEDDDDDDVSFDQPTNATRFKTLQSISDDDDDHEGDGRHDQNEKALHTESNYSKECITFSKNQAIITPMTSTKSKSDENVTMEPNHVGQSSKRKDLTKEVIDGSFDSKKAKPKTIITNFFSKFLPPTVNTNERIMENKSKHIQQTSPPRLSPRPSSSTNQRSTALSPCPPFPMQTTVTTPKRSPPQLQSTTNSITKKPISDNDMEIDMAVGIHAVSFRSRTQEQYILSPNLSPQPSSSADKPLTGIYHRLSPRLTPQPSSSANKYLTGFSPYPPFPTQTETSTPKRSPPQFQSPRIPTTKKTIRENDLEEDRTFGINATSFHIHTIPSKENEGAAYSTHQYSNPIYSSHVRSSKRKIMDIEMERNWNQNILQPIDLSSTGFSISDSPNNKENHEVQRQRLHKFIGLRNLGNSCYLNAALQMLFSVESFILDLERFHIEMRKASNPNHHCSMPLTENLLDLARRMMILPPSSADPMDFTSSSADPTKLKKAVDKATDKFLGYQQRDAHEFAATFIDLLHEEMTAVSNGGVVPTDTYFLMKIEVCLTCDTCGYSR